MCINTSFTSLITAGITINITRNQEFRNQLQIISSVGLLSGGQSCDSQVETGDPRGLYWRSARTEIPDIMDPQ